MNKKKKRDYWYQKECDDLCRMAAVYSKHGQYRQAENSYKLAIAMGEKNGDDTLDLAVTYYSLAELYSDQQQFDQAMPLYKKAVGIYEKQHPVDALSVLWYSDALGRLQKLMERNRSQWSENHEPDVKEAW